MKRIDFLKRLGIGAIAAISAPALLKGDEEETIKDLPDGWTDYRDNTIKDGDGLDIYFKQDGGEWQLLTSANAMTLEIPELESGYYSYEMLFNDKIILNGKLKVK